MSLPSSFASVNRKFPSWTRIRTAVAPIGSAIGEPAVVLSISIRLRMVHSLFHHDAAAVFANTTSTAPKSRIGLTNFVFMIGLVVSKISPETKRQPHVSAAGIGLADDGNSCIE